MQSKYKIRLIRANLLAASAMLLLLLVSGPLIAAAPLILAAAFLVVAAGRIDFSHHHPQRPPWQGLAGVLLLSAMASAPERHCRLIWAWAGVLRLPQKPATAAFNVTAALLSWWLIAPLLGRPEWFLLLATLSTLGMLAFYRSYQLTAINGTIRERLRLIPQLNMWPAEQLMRDLPREQKRAEREHVYAELIILDTKPPRLWSTAKQLCDRLHSFENTYRINSSTLATLLLSRSAEEGRQRRNALLSPYLSQQRYRAVPLDQINLNSLTLAQLSKATTQPGGALT